MDPPVLAVSTGLPRADPEGNGVLKFGSMGPSPSSVPLVITSHLQGSLLVLLSHSKLTRAD